jgi:hypothetical protein
LLLAITLAARGWGACGPGEAPIPEPLDATRSATSSPSRQAPRAGCYRVACWHRYQRDQLRERLKRYGIQRSLQGPHAALIEFAARLPAPILAERIRTPRGRAANWVRLAGATYADYVQLRNTASGRAGGSAEPLPSTSWATAGLQRSTVRCEPGLVVLLAATSRSTRIHHPVLNRGVGAGRRCLSASGRRGRPRGDLIGHDLVSITNAQRTRSTPHLVESPTRSERATVRHRPALRQAGFGRR